MAKMDAMKEIIYRSNTPEGLRKSMNDIGLKFPYNKKGLKKACDKALDYWSKIREREFPLDSIPLKPPKKLPQTEIVSNGKSYHIVGLMHGVRGNFKKYYYNQIKETSDKGNMVFLEENFKYHYARNLNGIEELKDHSLGEEKELWYSISQETIEDLSKYDSELSKKLTEALQYKEVDETLIEKIKEITKLDEFAELKIPFIGNVAFLMDVISTPESKITNYLLKSREISKRLQLPEPIQMKYNALNSCVSLCIKDFSKKLKKSDLSNTLRSNYMAWRMLKASKEFDEVYTFVGEGHEPEVECFLKAVLENKEISEIYPKDLSYYRYEN